MTDDTEQAHKALGALLAPLARLMVDQAIPLGDGVELLKAALITAAQQAAPKGSASQHSLMTGVHRKDIKRLAAAGPDMQTLSASARVLSLWQNDPAFQDGGQPRPLDRAGFDALAKAARVDAAPATMLGLLAASGNLRIDDNGGIHFVSALLVPAGTGDKLRAAVATLRPHLDTTIANVTGARPQWDQALRYSHLTEPAAQELEADAARLARAMLEQLSKRARILQAEAEGDRLFVAGSFTHTRKQDG